MTIQLNSSSMKKYKDDALVNQDGKCGLCSLPLDLSDPLSLHMDHCHETGHVRSVLHRACNTFEGMVKHKFSRSGLAGEHDYINWLKQLIVYLESDYSSNPLHPNHINDSIKRFKGKSKQEQIEILVDSGIEVPEKISKDGLVKLYRKYLRSFIR